MPANKIRRSDAGSEEKYERLTDKLNSILEQKIPKFYDYGRASGMNDGDTLEVPTFTSNMIDLAVLGPQPERTAAKEDSPREARTKKRHLIAQLESGDGQIDQSSLEDQIIKLISDTGGVASYDQIRQVTPDFTMQGGLPGQPSPLLDETLQKLIDKNMINYEKGNNFSISNTGPRFNAGDIPTNDGLVDKGGILSSIEALLPTSNNNSNMNKTANSLIHGLIDTLKIEDGQKEWFKAQVSDGVVSNQVFLRNLRASLQNNGGK